MLIVEMFMPGFGLPGIAGLVLLAASIVLTWTSHGALAGLGVTFVALSLSGIAATVSLKSAATGRLSRSPLILRDSESRDEGYASSSDMSRFQGREGIVLTILRPSGSAEIDGVRLAVVSDGEFIPKGARVRVVQVEGARVVVQEIKS